MLFLVLPDATPLPLYETPSVLVAAAQNQTQVSQALAKSTVRSMTYGVCELVPQNNWDFYDDMEYDQLVFLGAGQYLMQSVYMVDFLSAPLRDKLRQKHGSSIFQSEWDWFSDWVDSFKVTELHAPNHGMFINNGSSSTYLPNKGYVGKDRLDILVEAKDDLGRPIAMTIKYYINVLKRKDFAKAIDGDDDKEYTKALRKYCGANKGYWRISRADLIEFDANALKIIEFGGIWPAEARASSCLQSPENVR